MLGLEVASRRAVEWKDVDFYRKAMEDPTVQGTISIVTDPYWQIDGREPAERRRRSTRSCTQAAGRRAAQLGRR